MVLAAESSHHESDGFGKVFFRVPYRGDVGVDGRASARDPQVDRPRPLRTPAALFIDRHGGAPRPVLGSGKQAPPPRTDSLANRRQPTSLVQAADGLLARGSLAAALHRVGNVARLNPSGHRLIAIAAVRVQSFLHLLGSDLFRDGPRPGMGPRRGNIRGPGATAIGGELEIARPQDPASREDHGPL